MYRATPASVNPVPEAGEKTGLELGSGGGDFFLHSRACKAGLSGMRFSEGGQRPSRERASRIARSTRATCHKHTSSSVRQTPPQVGLGLGLGLGLGSVIGLGLG